MEDRALLPARRWRGSSGEDVGRVGRWDMTIDLKKGSLDATLIAGDEAEKVLGIEENKTEPEGCCCHDFPRSPISVFNSIVNR